MNKPLSASIPLLFAATLIAQCAPGDWPQWRGPNRDGVSAETGLLKEWPAGGPKLLWKAHGLGAGYSTVAVAGKQIFTLGERGPHNFVVALNLADGARLWQSQLGKAGAPGWGGYGGPRSTPTVDSGLVFAVGQYGEVACLDAATGSVKWRKDCEKDFGGELQAWGYTSVPLGD